jgi:hypothetical protein
VRGIVRADANAEASQIIDTGRIRVAPRDLHSAPHEELGESAHACAGDAHEVDGSWVRGIEEWHVRRGI